jgi:hypothetical protein
MEVKKPLQIVGAGPGILLEKAGMAPKITAVACFRGLYGEDAHE